jgi:dynein heavy chain
LSELKEYHVPTGTTLDSFKQFIKNLPMEDDPRAFGQHPNAAIASQISETTDMLKTLLSLGGNPSTESVPDEDGVAPLTDDDKVLAIAADLERDAPRPFDIKVITESLRARVILIL